MAFDRYLSSSTSCLISFSYIDMAMILCVQHQPANGYTSFCVANATDGIMVGMFFIESY